MRIPNKKVALLVPVIWIICACLPIIAEDGEKAAKEAQCVSAIAIVEGCEIDGKIMQVKFDPERGRWAPLRTVIKLRNTSDDGRKISFFCQIISQDSKNHSDAFVFSEGTYEMAIAPRETIVRDFPFIDLMASMPSGYMKDTVAIRIGRKPFERYGDHIPIKTNVKLNVGDEPVTVAVRALGRTDKDAKSSVLVRQAFAKGAIPVTLEHKTTSPDGKLFAGYYRDGWDEVISIHDAETGKQIKRIVGHGDNVRRFEFAQDGKFLASRCVNSSRKGWALWDVSTGKLILRLKD